MTPELEAYIERHIEPAPGYLTRLERATNLQRVNGRMCSGHIQGRLLKMITRMINPKNALELGTFTGYSALCIAEGMKPGSMLTTIEIEDELREPILEVFKEAGFGENPSENDGKAAIRLLTGDALEICKDYGEGSFDMIFIDADKRQYPDYFRQAMRLLRDGGYMIADNTLWDSHVVEPQRHDRQTEGVKEFNLLVASDPRLETVIVPLRDGLTIARKKP